MRLPDHECTIEFETSTGAITRATRVASGHWYPEGKSFGYLEPNLILIYGIQDYSVIESSHGDLRS